MILPVACACAGIFARVLPAPLLFVAAIFGYRTLRKRAIPDNFGVVEEGKIYRSGRLSPRLLEKTIAKRGIRTIICFYVNEMSESECARFRSICDRHGVRVVSIAMPGDGTGGFDQYDLALDVLREPGGPPVLACCGRGVHRTGALVAAYRVLVQGRRFEEALKEMQKYGFRPRPYRYRGGEHPLVPHLKNYLSARTLTYDHEKHG